MSLKRDPRLKEIAKTFCRDLRKRSTKSEKIFWQAVRNRKLSDKKFYRQYPIFFDLLGKETFYIADFFCFENRLVIELDGKIHNYQIEQDMLRNFVMTNLGITVIRIKNEEIEKDLECVLERVKKYLI